MTNLSNYGLNLSIAPYLHVIEGEPSNIYDFGLSLTTDVSFNVVVRFLRGRKMHSLDGLDNEFAAAMQFPWYYGENWPAFDECLKDLSWISAEVYLLFIYHSNEVLVAEDKEQFSVFIRILQEIGEDWSKPMEGSDIWNRPATPFHVIFHANPGEKQNVMLRLESVAACYNEIQLVTLP